jgi:hypothetical protein
LIAHTQSSKPQKVSQTGDESAGRLAQSYGVLAPTVSPFYHKLTTLLIEEEEEATGIPFPSTAWQQSLLLVLDLSNFYQIQPTAFWRKNKLFKNPRGHKFEELSAEMPSSYDGDSTTTNTTMHQVLEGLQNSQGNKEIPFSLLYDKKGSELYEEITKLEEYYPFLAEDHMLELHVDEIAAQIPPHSVIVELGCGTARKTAKILSAIQACHGRCL